jgi:hypothetical protein
MQVQSAKSVVATKRKTTRALSERVAAAAEKRAMRAPLTVVGISPGKLQTIPPSRFAKLDVDPSYQRGHTVMIFELVRVLQAGGKILDPVTLCKRPWANDGDKLWIIDGHQRVCAFQQLGFPFEAMIHDSENVEAEKNFFLSLNKRHTVGGDVIVKSWTGPSAQMLIEANANPDHPLYDRVHFGQGAARSQLSAALIIRGTAAAATGSGYSGQIQRQLSKLDYAIRENARKYLAEHYLRMFGMIYAHGTISSFVAIRLGLVAFQRWAQQSRDFPSMAVIEKLRAVDWQQEVPHFNSKFAPVVTNIIQDIWKR